MSMRMTVSMLREILSEAAVSGTRAASMGAALVVLGDELVLYDSRHYLDRVEEFLENERNEEISDEACDAAIERMFADPGGIVGYVLLKPACKQSGIMQTHNVAAAKGFGPLLYDVAMAHAPEGLIPDRTSVSDSASAVWTYYGRRRSDVTKEPMRPRRPGARTSTDGCALHNDPEHPELDVVYRSTRSPAVAGLKKRHASVVATLMRMYADAGRDDPDFDVVNSLATAGLDFFLKKFR